MFDKFHVSRCELSTFVNFAIDGRRNKNWFDTDEKEQENDALIRWDYLKSTMFGLIRGEKTPERMVIDFCHYLKNGDMGSLRIQFEKDCLLIYTGYMQKNFSFDKENQESWDENCQKFLNNNGIVSTQL